jgi:hypothetical protein
MNDEVVEIKALLMGSADEVHVGTGSGLQLARG